MAYTMKETTRKKIINVIVYLILAALAASLMYNTYLEMVNQGKADSIEVLKGRIAREIIENRDTLQARDSVIENLQDSIILITPNN